MALITSNGRYIKLTDNEGSFEVYESVEVRDSVKNAPLPEDILKKYDELIEEAQTLYENYLINNKIAYMGENRVLIPVDPSFTEDDFAKLLEENGELAELYKKWTGLLEEKRFYEDDLYFKNGCTHDHKYMKEYFPDMDKSLPKILETAKIELSGETIADAYEDAKDLKRFGDTIDA